MREIRGEDLRVKDRDCGLGGRGLIRDLQQHGNFFVYS